MNLFIQDAAERDILDQVEWSAEKGVPAIGLRFSDAVAESLKAIIATSLSGAPMAITARRLAHMAFEGVW